MSEYQYYEFTAVDKPLTEKDMQALRKLSSRAQITPTSFVNEYNWGDFKGNPLKLVEKYFDAFLYVANWGSRWLMFKVPRNLFDFDLVKKYCPGGSAVIHEKGGHLIFEFTSEIDDHEWEEGEGWLSSLISLRADIINSDYRSLYLAWLFCAHREEMEDDESEPPVPPNLADLDAPLKSFVDFMRIDTDLIAVAAENSIWEKVDENIVLKKAAKYDEAVKLPVDLRDLNNKAGTEKAFQQKLKTICENHHRKVSFLNRLQKAGLGC